jgi:hypothetical protein
MSARFADKLKVLPHLAPQNITTGAVSGDGMLLKYLNWVTFLVSLGAMTSDSTDTVTFTVESSTGASTNSNDVAIPFTYRLSSALGTDNHGAATTCSTAGVAMNAATHDNMMLIIDVDPAILPTEDSDAAYIRVVATPSAENAGCLLSAVAVCETRYPGAEQPAVT